MTASLLGSPGLFCVFYLVAFQWSLSDSKSPWVSKTLLSILFGGLSVESSNSKSPWVSRTLRSILADLNNDVVCMVLILSLISKPSSHFSKLLGTVPSRQLSFVSPSPACSTAFFSGIWQEPLNLLLFFVFLFVCLFVCLLVCLLLSCSLIIFFFFLLF